MIKYINVLILKHLIIKNLKLIKNFKFQIENLYIDHRLFYNICQVPVYRNTVIKR